jgi:hypothetical protein
MSEIVNARGQDLSDLDAYEAAAKALAESGKKPDENKKDLIMQSVDVST